MVGNAVYQTVFHSKGFKQEQETFAQDSLQTLETRETNHRLSTFPKADKKIKHKSRKSRVHIEKLFLPKIYARRFSLLLVKIINAKLNWQLRI
jgi:hypothetical protein